MISFIGETIHRAKLKLTDPPANFSTNSFIGFVEMEGLQNPATGEGLKLMYFRDYEWDGQSDPQSVVFNDNPFQRSGNTPVSEEFMFDLCFMRIPPEFDFMLMSEDHQHVAPINRDRKQFYYGLTLLNIHREVQGTLRATDPLAAKTFVKPNHHYYVNDFYEQQGITAPPGGLRGCRPFASFGTNKLALFEGIHPDDSRLEYYMLSAGTDATVGYCLFENKSKMVEFTSSLTSTITNRRNIGDRLGISATEFLKYDTTLSRSKYGVHIIPIGADGRKGWDTDWFEQGTYKE